ncbi:ketopantoate reductase family protein [Sulfurimonas autotrophica]|uniref:2-dehydropantoate 2-reductase n=1 Tax=Sulfurimonas autotrophica (strain ATCC BAA-671 / DSM 16294 / JCM 11897 / OK10) TaxID=563040 RepID=E0UT65_SULAO|nr:2-dehydropantoate 2-reductase [Sulfurimonas autotrophica]ADN08168.1 2-dehydropantoate 2-reductase [Sulfurimonas autotrophica DSM 16294]
MKIAIVGLGGVGGYLAASFTKSGLDVVGFARGAHLKAIKKTGIRIIEDETEWSTPLHVKNLDEAEGYFDVVMFCTKSYDLPDACKALQNHIDANSILLSFSNGVNNGDMLREFCDAKVLDACIYILAHIESPGVIRKKGKVFAALFGPQSEAAQTVAELFEKVSLRYKIPQNIKEALYKKYIFIAAFATLTAYYNTSIGAVYEKHYDEAKKLLTEIAEFAKETQDIDIFDEVQKSLDTAAKVPYDSSTSMYLDFKNGKKTELENLSGYVQKPFMQKLYNELKKRA